MTPTTAAERGKANRRQGHDAERDLARYLREWWPDAARKADTGWRRGDLVNADHGDIKGIPGLVWQVKHVARLNVHLAIADAIEQATAAGADYGILVQRRDGKTDPGRWWAWVTVVDLARLVGLEHLPPALIGKPVFVAPVCLEVRYLVALLLAAGYGPPDDPATVAALAS